jgi:hippurate hydrolase
LAELHNARIEVTIDYGYPPVINSQREANIARRAAAKIVGSSQVMAMDHPNMGSEDFSYYL